MGTQATIRRITPLVAALALLLALAMPVAAGKFSCSLQATVGGGSATEVETGEEVLIEGFGFPPGDVEITYSVGGTPIDTVTVTADGTGAFETTVTPQVGEEGLWTVTASDPEELCIAETGFLVVAAPVTPSPTPTPTPQGELPDVAAPTSDGGTGAAVLGALFVAAAVVVALRPRLARRVR